MIMNGFEKMNFKEQLDEILQKYSNKKSVMLSLRNNIQILDWLKSQVKYNTKTISELIFLYENPNFNPVCELGNKRTFSDGKYRHGCGGKCVCAKKSMIENYRKTCFEKYGKSSPLQVESIKNKIKQTLLNKYGVSHQMNLDTTKQKFKQTNIEKYGVDNPFQSEQIKQKIKETFLKKYGVENPNKNQLIREKIEKTNLEKYGVLHTGQKHLNGEIISKYNNCNWLFEQHHLNKKSCLEIANQLGVGVSLIHKKMNEFNIEINRSFRSFPEKQLEAMILLFDNEMILQKNTRKIIDSNEIDIFIPKKNIAIEFCGLYWHSEITGGKDSNYHLNKLKLCNEKNIRLITIFSDEWENKQEIVKNRLKHVLGFEHKICSARQTEIRPISSELYSLFVDQHHIQGSIASKIKLGAFYKDQLVAAMGLGARRRNLGVKNTRLGDYEMLRFCSKGHIPGVGSKLFKYFVDNHSPNQVTSYADRRWGEGEFYRHLGFEFVSSTPPGYFYTNDYKKRHNRFAFRKDVIVREMGGDPNKTEWENMQEMGWDRIWDCGTNKWVWNK